MATTDASAPLLVAGDAGAQLRAALDALQSTHVPAVRVALAALEDAV